MAESLVEWLNAQLEADQREALCATFCDPDDSTDGDFTEWHVEASDPKWPAGVAVANGTPVVAAGYNGAYEHIARWDPARVLAEVAAKRRILELHKHERAKAPSRLVRQREASDIGCIICADWDGMTAAEGWCDTVRLLALPYAGRDGYRDEWRPE